MAAHTPVGALPAAAVAMARTILHLSSKAAAAVLVREDEDEVAPRMAEDERALEVDEVALEARATAPLRQQQEQHHPQRPPLLLRRSPSSQRRLLRRRRSGAS